MSDPGGNPAQGSEWPAGLAPLVSTEPLKGGFICSTVRGRLADGREVVVKRCPYAARSRPTASRRWPPPASRCRPCSGSPARRSCERVGGPPDWAGLGQAIAGLHRTTGDRFGWHRDNFQGITVQPNGWSDDWPSFYVAHRVRPHLGDPRVPEPLRRRIERACEGPLPALLQPRPPPSLTHGDLWVGNVIEGRWVVDPAVSFADRELELAYMQLSDSLPAELWDAYLDDWPPDPGYERRRPAPAAQVPQQHPPLRPRPVRAPDRGRPTTYGW